MNQVDVLGFGTGVTSIGLRFSGKKPHERALSTPILADERQNATRTRIKRDLIDGFCGAERLT